MDKQELKSFTNKNIIQLEEKTFDLLEELLKVTLDANERFNLTGIKEEGEFRSSMIYDSLIPLKYINIEGKTVLDVGTGGGFPGLVRAISSPKTRFTLLDSTQKKIEHILAFAKQHNLTNVEGVYVRAEEYALANREKYDFVVSRAVAPLNILSELCLPFVKVGGSFIAYKGDKANEEIKEAKKAIEKLGGEVVENYLDNIPDCEAKRYTVVIKKVKITPKKYPRNYSDIKRKPL